MKLSEYKATYYEFTGNASDAARSAAFAGIALAWVFKVDDSSGPNLPSGLVLPTGLFALTLALDLLQYLIGAIIWGVFCRLEEKKLSNPEKDDPELSHPGALNVPMRFVFYLKMCTVIVGYIWVGIFVVDKWSS